MSIFSFIGDAVDLVGDFFGSGDLSGQLITAGIKTAGEFAIGGSSGSGQQTSTRQPQIQSKIASGVATSRVPRPDVPNAPGVVDVDTFYAEWLARMRQFSTLASSTDTGGPRTLGTQVRRN